MFGGTSVADQGGFGLNINSRRRHRERAFDDRVLGPRGLDEGHREHVELAQGHAQLPDGRRVDARGRVAPEPDLRADDQLRRRRQRPDHDDLQHDELPGRVDHAAQRGARSLLDADRPGHRDQRRAAARRGHGRIHLPRPRHAARAAASTTASSSPTRGGGSRTSRSTSVCATSCSSRSIRGTTATRRRRSRTCGAARRRAGNLFMPGT